jgi:EmrB/QacA subfamily drug resistance transporter
MEANNSISEIAAEKRYRSLAIIIVMMGVTMSAIDTTAVVLGLPVIMRDLHSNIISMIWVIMSYLLVITVAGTQVGRLGDMFGRVRMYNLGFAVFTVGSLFCAFSTNGPQLISFRVLQGIGGALVSSNSGAIIADTFPQRERGKAYGFTGVGWSVGAIFGILIGGAFVTFLNWRYIFLINLPIGVLATTAGYVLLKERSPKLRARLDPVGIVLLAAGLFAVLLSLTDMTGSGYSIRYGTEFVVGISLMIAFAFWEKRFTSPLLDLAILRERVLSASVLAAFFQALASFAVIFLIIMYLQGPRGLTPWNASLLLIPGYVLGGMIAPFAGKLSDKLGARVVASVGLLAQVVGIVIYSTLGLNSSLYIVVLGSIVNGAGSSSFFPANNSAVMASAPPNAYGVANGLLRTLSNTGMVSSFALALLIASISIPRELSFQIFLGVGGIQGTLSSAFVDGMHAALLSTIALLSVALLLSVLRGKETRTMAPEPVISARPTGQLSVEKA